MPVYNMLVKRTAVVECSTLDQGVAGLTLTETLS